MPTLIANGAGSKERKVYAVQYIAAFTAIGLLSVHVERHVCPSVHRLRASVAAILW